MNAFVFPPLNSTTSSVSWNACPPQLGFPSALECATFSVPVDWDTPYGEHFDLGLVKLPAIPSNTTSKIGPLFINPGGPGSPASGIVASMALGAFEHQTLQLRAWFDIIGLDPRGVGLSHQVNCSKEIYAEAISLFPQTQEEYDALADKNKRLGESCRELTGPLLEHVDTISAAKDHEAVRVALGNEPMNFLGLSYGSQLAAQYISLFPNNVRTLALDAVVQHSQAKAAEILIGASSYEHVLEHFFEWAATDNSSALRGQDAKAVWVNVLASAKKTPIPALSCDGVNCRQFVTDEDIRFNAQGHLNFPGSGNGLGASWVLLASALSNASHGDATALSTYSNPEIFSRLAIQCLDWDRSNSLTEVKAKSIMADTYSGLVGGANHRWHSQHACIGWPASVKNPPKKLDVVSETTVLMVTSTGDASTGLPLAVGLLEEIPNAVLIVRQGDGHGSLPMGGEASELFLEYLVTGKAPAERFLTTTS
ncbi:tap domain-containing protein [Curvularia clavata]|uniref:Tap domain-containing protein n=1 Tax=Curvularia clavata TaxID=95742 RepID=A0A9Q9DVL4_CURCL|nr:tap domain-containing protein [Curvularia clavata]